MLQFPPSILFNIWTRNLIAGFALKNTTATLRRGLVQLLFVKNVTHLRREGEYLALQADQHGCLQSGSDKRRRLMIMTRALAQCKCRYRTGLYRAATCIVCSAAVKLKTTPAGPASTASQSSRRLWSHRPSSSESPFRFLALPPPREGYPVQSANW